MIERPQSTWVKRQRNPASVTGAAYHSNGSWTRVHMTNLSYDGCHLLTDNRLDIGEMLTLILPRMHNITAQVRWAKDNEAGVRFLQNNVADERRARLGI